MTTALRPPADSDCAARVRASFDSACGYAASTLMPADAGVLAIEFKIGAGTRRHRALTEELPP